MTMTMMNGANLMNDFSKAFSELLNAGKLLADYVERDDDNHTYLGENSLLGDTPLGKAVQLFKTIGDRKTEGSLAGLNRLPLPGEVFIVENDGGYIRQCVVVSSHSEGKQCFALMISSSSHILKDYSFDAIKEIIKNVGFDEKSCRFSV